MATTARRRASGAASPHPLGATWDGAGRELRAVLARTPSGSSCACSTRRAGARSSASTCPSAPTSSGTATCRRRAPACSTATACTARTRPSAGHRFNPHKLLLDPYARALVGPLALERRALRLSRRQPARGPVVRHARQRRAACRSAQVVDPAFTGATTARRASPLEGHGHLRGARQGASPSCHPDVPAAAARHVRGPRQRAGDRPPEAPRRHRGRAAAGARLRRRPAPGRAWACATTGATTPSASSRPRRATRRDRHGAASSRRWSRRCTPRPRGDPRRRLQPHRRRQPARARRCRFRGIDNRVLLPARREDRRYYADFTGSGNTLSTQHPRVLRLMIDSLRYWVERDARRRLPLRPRRPRSRASSTQFDHVRRVPRHRAPGPGARRRSS